MSSTTSIEKAEKVVKEPNKPTIIKYLINSSEKFLLCIIAITHPIKKDPKILIHNVIIK